MSKPRLNFEIVFDTIAHAEIVKTNFEAELIGKDIYEKHNFSTISEDGITKLLSDFRFNQVIDRDILFSFIKSKMTSGVSKNWILPDSKVIRHICTHDDIIIMDCTTTQYEEFIK